MQHGNRRVTMKEIEENDYNLNISRYTSTAAAKEEVDMAAMHTRLVELEGKIGKATQDYNKYLSELGLAPRPLGAITVQRRNVAL